MPSEHTKMARSLALSLLIILMKGSALTPHFFARLSPKLRDIASPGYLTSLLQTRIGPTFFPVI